MAVSVLIVSYRAYDALLTCLASLDWQLGDDDEVIVVDHASDPDGLRRVASACPRARLLPTPENPGLAAGINRAARVATGRTLLILNPDVEFHGRVVQPMADYLASHDDVGVVGPRLLNGDGSWQASARGFPDASTVLGARTTWLSARYPNNWFSRRNLLGRSATGPTSVGWISGACLMTPRALFDRLEGLDEGFFLYWEDTDYCRRVQDAGYGVTYLPALVARHPGGASSRHDLAGAMRIFHRSAYRYYRKHAGHAWRLLAPLVWLGLRLRGEARARMVRMR